VTVTERVLNRSVTVTEVFGIKWGRYVEGFGLDV
jgi:hypothetical protein